MVARPRPCAGPDFPRCRSPAQVAESTFEALLLCRKTGYLPRVNDAGRKGKCWLCIRPASSAMLNLMEADNKSAHTTLSQQSHCAHTLTLSVESAAAEVMTGYRLFSANCRLFPPCKTRGQKRGQQQRRDSAACARHVTCQCWRAVT